MMFIAPEPTYDTYFPLLSNWKFGNATFANYGETQAMMTGNVGLNNNISFARTWPEQLPFGSQMIGDQNLPNQILPEGQRPNDYQSSGAETDGENRLWHFFKLQFVGFLALIILVVGLYLLSQETEAGKAIKEKVVDVAKGAAGPVGAAV